MSEPMFSSVKVRRSLVAEFRRARNVVVRTNAANTFTGSSREQNTAMVLAAMMLAEQVEKETP